MLSLANSHWLIGVAYGVAALLMLVGWRRDSSVIAGAWPAIWVSSGGLLALMAIARATDLGHAGTGALHRRAVDGDWYDARKPLQVAALCSLVAMWTLAVIVFQRLAKRRRRYMPVIVVISAVALFAAVRVVSLHRVDTLLQRHELEHARYGSIIEWTIVVAAAVCAVVVPRSVESHG